MQKVRVTTTIMVMAFVSLTAMSCKDSKKEESAAPMSSEMHQENVSEKTDEMAMNDEQN